MTRDEILNIPAGREMDVLIAENLFGFQWLPWSGNNEQKVLVRFPGQAEAIDWWGKDIRWLVPHYSTDIAAAWEVMEIIRMHLSPFGNGVWICYNQHDLNKATVAHVADTAPLAICRAALLATMDGNL